MSEILTEPVYIFLKLTECLKNSFVCNGSNLWNDIHHVIRDVPTLNTFKTYLKQYIS